MGHRVSNLFRLTSITAEGRWPLRHWTDVYQKSQYDPGPGSFYSIVAEQETPGCTTRFWIFPEDSRRHDN